MDLRIIKKRWRKWCYFTYFQPIVKGSPGAGVMSDCTIDYRV